MLFRYDLQYLLVSPKRTARQLGFALSAKEYEFKIRATRTCSKDFGGSAHVGSCTFRTFSCVVPIPPRLGARVVCASAFTVGALVSVKHSGSSI